MGRTPAPNALTTIGEDFEEDATDSEPRGWADLGQPDLRREAANQARAAAAARAEAGRAHQAQFAARDPQGAVQDLENRRQALASLVPAVDRSPDLAGARAALEDHFNAEYAAPEANAKQGWFNTGEYTEAAAQRRREIDRRKAQAQAQLRDLELRTPVVAAAQQDASEQEALSRARQERARQFAAAHLSTAGTPVPPPPEAPATPTAPKPQAESGWRNVWRGAKVSLLQLPPLAYGTLALIGATAEKITGEGGSSTALKQWGLKGYEEGMARTQEVAHENDDVTKAWAKAKRGDLGALVDWAEYATGYLLGQAGETVGVALLAGLAGGAAGTAVEPVGGTVVGAGTAAVAGAAAKQATKATIRTMVEKLVARKALELAERQAQKQLIRTGAKATAEQIAEKAATPALRKAATASIGQSTALAANSLMMEAGGIFPEAVKQAHEEGRELTGTDLAKVWAMAIAAGGVDALTDKLGLDAALGRLPRMIKDNRLANAVVTGVGTAATGGISEVAQTVLERVGAGQHLTDAEAQSDYLNSALMGALGGGLLGGTSSLRRGPEQHTVPPPAAGPSPSPQGPLVPGRAMQADAPDAARNPLVPATPQAPVSPRPSAALERPVVTAGPLLSTPPEAEGRSDAPSSGRLERTPDEIPRNAETSPPTALPDAPIRNDREAARGDLQEAVSATSSPAEQRVWGDLDGSDVGSTVETRDGRKGVIHQLGKGGVAIQPADGNRFGVRPEEVRVVSQSPQQSVPSDSRAGTLDARRDGAFEASGAGWAGNSVGSPQPITAGQGLGSRALLPSAQRHAAPSSRVATDPGMLLNGAEPLNADRRRKGVRPVRAFTAMQMKALVQGLHGQYRALFAAVGVGEPAIDRSSPSALAMENGRLLIHPEVLAEESSTLAKMGIETKAWLQKVMWEEWLHAVQMKAEARAGRNWTETYTDLWNDPDLDPKLREGARQAYAGFDALSDAQKGVEVMRMVLSARWHGMITERIYRAVQSFVDYLRGVRPEAQKSVLFQETLARAEAVIAEAQQQVRQRSSPEQEGRSSNASLDETSSDGGAQKKRRLVPNAKFVVNGYHYETDALGRVTKVSGTLKLAAGVRNPYFQRVAGRNDGRRPTDVGGHLIAVQFDGPNGPINVVPMDARLNSNHKVLGKWGQMEMKWAAALRGSPGKPGQQVHVTIEPIYTDDSGRPSSFEVTERIDKKTTEYNYKNQPGG